jgi:ATP-binding cassette subfamily F protein 3
MLEFEQLSLRRGERLLLDHVDLRIYPGHKIGLIGANGCGKSSLFALLCGELTADTGTYRIPPAWRIAHVAQQTPSGTDSIVDFILDGDQALRQTQRALEQAQQKGDGVQEALLHDQLQTLDGYCAEARATRLLHGLGFAPGDETRAIESYSGGWRRRLALGQALMCQSDLLLLDEPTNHLDLDAIVWLEGWLRDYPGTLFLIAHDRDFLDAVVTQIIHIEQAKLNLYNGHYSAFERQRAAQLAQQQAAYERQQREVAHLQSFINRFRAKATKARQAQSRLKALERLEMIAPAHIDNPFRFRFLEPDQAPNPLLRLEHITMRYDDHVVLNEITFSCYPGQRIALLGANGAGKSTLMQLFAGELIPTHGQRLPFPGLKIGYFAQHQIDQLHLQDSPLQLLRRLDQQATEQSLRDYLGGFDFCGDRTTQPLAHCSGGERARLVLALLIYQRPNLLLLDEPTNHLDLDMRYALGQALQTFTGAFIFVSHDRHLLRLVCDDYWVVHHGRVEPFTASLDEYPGWLAAQRQGLQQADAAQKSVTTRKHQRQQDAALRQRLQPLRQQWRSLEQQLETLQSRCVTLEQQLADSTLYEASSKMQLLTLLEQKRQLDALLVTTEAAWLEVGEALERAETE